MIACSQKKQKYTAPEAEKGILDLLGWDFKNDGFLRLNGEWEFYWNQLLTPNDFINDIPRMTGYFEMPGLWNSMIVDGNKLSGQGYATFRLLIKVDDKYENLGIKVLTFATAARLYINGENIMEMGKTGKNVYSSKPYFDPMTIGFINDTSIIEVILQVSNFHHRKGGLWRELKIGLRDDIEERDKKTLIYDMFLLGCIIIMSFYHLGLYIIRRRDKSTLYFFLGSLMVAFRVLSTGEYLIEESLLFSWFTIIKIEYISGYLACIFMFSFIYVLYKEYFPPKLFISALIPAILMVLITLLTQPIFYSKIIAVYQFFIVIYSFLCIWIFIKAIQYKRAITLSLLIGFVFIVLAIINDILYNSEIIQTRNMISLGLVAFIFTQSVAISIRFSSAFVKSEELSRRLHEVNRNLEKNVRKRTTKIEYQKKELEFKADQLKQINSELKELAKFKEGMTGMIVHDMKNLLNHIINYSDIKNNVSLSNLSTSEVIKQNAKQLLHLVLNILDIQRFETAKLKLNLQFDFLSKIVNDAIENIRYLALEKNIIIENKIKNYSVFVDFDILLRVFVNLLTNAIKYSHPNEKIVINSEKSDEYLYISVKDFGIGVPEIMHQKIFQKFEIIENPDHNDKQSTGLGLTFCKYAIEAHNGEIGVDSRPNYGSVFWFTLPLSNVITKTESDEKLKFDTDKKIYFTEQEKTIMMSFYHDLKNVKVYEITTLKNILSRIKINNSTNIKLWLQEIQEAIFIGNEEKYNELLQLLV